MSFVRKIIVITATSLCIISCKSTGQQARLRHEHNQGPYAADTNIGVYMHRPPYRTKDIEFRPQLRFPDIANKEPLSFCKKKYDQLLVALDDCYAESTEYSKHFSATSECVDYELTRRHCHIPWALAEATTPENSGSAGHWLRELPMRQTYNYREDFVLRLLSDFKCDQSDLPSWATAKYKQEICEKALEAKNILKAEMVTYDKYDQKEEKAENRERKIQELTLKLMSQECRRYGRVCSERKPTAYEPNPSCDLYRDCWDNYYEKALKRLR